jgi:hypothetical protein
VYWNVCDPQFAGSVTDPVPQTEPTMQMVSLVMLLDTVTVSAKVAAPGSVAVNAGELEKSKPEPAPPLTVKLAPDRYPAATGSSRLAIFP